MNFIEAKKYLWGGQRLARESWSAGFYIEAASQDQNRRLSLLDSTGRFYGVSSGDELATDWILHDSDNEQLMQEKK